METLEIIKSFKKSAAEKGLYIATKNDIPRLVEASVDGYGGEYRLCQWMDQGGDGTNLENRLIHPKGWAATWKANYTDVFDQSIILADSSEINSLIMWLPPHFKEASNLDWLLGGGLEALFHMGLKEMIRFDTYEKYCHLQRHIYGADSFYALNLVVRKSAQGKGLGSHLMKSTLEIIDELGGSAYLETHSQRNVELYQKMGFTLMCDDPIPGTKLKHYAMKRGKR